MSEAGNANAASKPTLARTMGLGALIIYGVGDMLGAGIYGLIGKAAGVMGNAVWLSFVASMIAAAFTGLSYASLGSRYPRAAGAAYVAYRAFRLPPLSYLVGLACVASGLVSMAAGSHAFSGYLLSMFGITEVSWGNTAAVVIGYVLILTAINYRGMRESTWMNAIFTAVEVGGLLFIVAIGVRFWGGGINYLETPNASEGMSFSLILTGAVLTFYSFVGFEDMINVTEEVKNPERNFPIALIAALAIAAVIYIAVAITAVSVVPYAELAKSGQPLAEVVKRAAPWFPRIEMLFALIAIFAVANTGLLNYITGSRIVYGLAQQGLVPKFLGEVHHRRRTPHKAIVLLMFIVLGLALSGDIKVLASAASALLLMVFVLVNLSLIRLKFRRDEPRGQFEVPVFVPICGVVACGLILWNVNFQAMRLASILLAGIGVLYLIMRPKGDCVAD